MSNLIYNANGEVFYSNTIETMVDVAKTQANVAQTQTNVAQTQDFFNLAGNLKLSGRMIATEFVKEDGKPLDTVTKVGLPKNVYYMDNKVGINVDKPTADLDVKGGVKLSNTSSDGKFGNVLTIDSDAESEGTKINLMHKGKNAGYIMGDNKSKKFIIGAETGNNVLIGGDLETTGKFDSNAGSFYRAVDHSALYVKNDQKQGAYFWINDSGRDADGGKLTATLRNDIGNMRVQSKGSKGITIEKDTGNVTFDGAINNKDGLVVGPSKWGKYTVFGGSDRDVAKGQAQVHTTDGNLHLDSANDRNLFLQYYSKKPVLIGDANNSSVAGLTIKGRAHEHGTTWFESEKGNNPSHVHWGPTGDWYLRSAKSEGTVFIQDTAPNGTTTISSNLNLKGGVSKHNPDKWGTHFPFTGDQKNYIRGDTEIRGDTNQMGILRVATNGGQSDATGEQLTIGTTNESNLRLGRHADYSWIQSHGAKPLKINPLGNQVHVSDIGSDNYFMVNRYDKSGITGSIKNAGRDPVNFKSGQAGNNVQAQLVGCPADNNWAAICPKGSVQVGMSASCEGFYPICRNLG